MSPKGLDNNSKYILATCIRKMKRKKKDEKLALETKGYPI